MKSCRVLLWVALLLVLGTGTSAFADTQLSNYVVYAGGGVVCNGCFGVISGTTDFTITTTGPTAGIALDYDVNMAAFSYEYGQLNGTLSLGDAAGVSWAIDDWNNLTGDAYDAVANGTLPLGDACIMDCNASSLGDVLGAFGFDLSNLPAGDQAKITINSYTSDPGVPNLELIHPAGDPYGDPASAVYMTESVIYEPIGPTPVPEPSSLLLLGSGIPAVIALRRKLFRA